MGAATANSVLERATVEEAQEELSKFFTIAAAADQAPEMFSAFIDAEWHRLMETPDYPEFCMRSVGQHVGHAPSLGDGEIHWIDMYHQRFGALPSAWFADETGVVDTDAMADYLDTQTVRASWNCQPTTNDPDNRVHTK